MKITKITIGDQEHLVPKSWNDLKRPVLLRIFDLLCVRNRDLTQAEGLADFLKLEAMRAVLGLTKKDLSDWEIKCVAEHGEEGTTVFLDQVQMTADAFTEFLYDRSDKEQPKITCNLTRLPYRTLKSAGPLQKNSVLHGPADELENLTLGELAECFTLYELYLEDQKSEHVDRLLATLFRPHKSRSKRNKRTNYGGDVRLPFLGYEATVELRIERMKGLPQGVRSLLLFWFGCCRKTIIDRYANIFSGNTSDKKGNDYGYGGLMLSLAEGLVGLDEVAGQPFDNAFMYLSMLQDRATEAEFKRVTAGH